MSGLMSRGVVLTVSRVSNFGILVLSPLLLVRILDVDSYGSYQEFMIYATLLITFCSFGIDSSLTYFLPRYPDHEREFVSQNSVLILTSSAALLTVFALFRKPFLEVTSYDFVFPLIVYVFCFVNLNWLEFYWIAKKRTDLVWYYSAARLFVRLTTLLVTAFVTRDVQTIIWSLVVVEALRLFLVLGFLLHFNLLTFRLDTVRIKEQLFFAGPVGIAALMQQGSRHVGKLFVGSVLGPAALAYYAVASYLLPMVRVLRSSISDVVFPELVRSRNDPAGALRLWQRTNIIFCVLLFPPFAILNWYAELFITTLFTERYLPSVPVFQLYLIWLLRRCFNMDVLLRTKGRTGFMLTGTAVSVVVNLGLMIVLYRHFGLIGPAAAFITSEILLEIYYATLVKREFRLSLSDLLDWPGLWRVAAACIVGLPIFYVIDLMPLPPLVRILLASPLYVAVSWYAAFRLGILDISRIVQFASSRAKRIILRSPPR